MHIILGADHAATALKEVVKNALTERGYTIEDVSPSHPQSGDDYPDYAIAVGDRVAGDPAETRGILACDTGIGMAIAANKVQAVRAALVVNEFGARRARQHNDANVLVFGAELINPEEAVRAALAFLETPFSREERHARRLGKIRAQEGTSVPRTSGQDR